MLSTGRTFVPSTYRYSVLVYVAASSFEHLLLVVSNNCEVVVSNNCEVVVSKIQCYEHSLEL